MTEAATWGGDVGRRHGNHPALPVGQALREGAERGLGELHAVADVVACTGGSRRVEAERVRRRSRVQEDVVDGAVLRLDGLPGPHAPVGIGCVPLVQADPLTVRPESRDEGFRLGPAIAEHGVDRASRDGQSLDQGGAEPSASARDEGGPACQLPPVDQIRHLSAYVLGRGRRSLTPHDDTHLDLGRGPSGVRLTGQPNCTEAVVEVGDLRLRPEPPWFRSLQKDQVQAADHGRAPWHLHARDVAGPAQDGGVFDSDTVVRQPETGHQCLQRLPVRTVVAAREISRGDVL